MIVSVSGPFPKHRAQCEICEAETEFVTYSSEEPWCQDCGYAPSRLLPDNNPGGCPAHPNATHETGYGLAGGGFGVYSICNECGSVFDKVEDMSDD